ncbi:MAG: helix-turn-helix domain-containing protein [Myxococcota bacterium]
MKKTAVASKTRPYDNRLRQEQASENRQRILDAALTLLAEEPGNAFSVQAVALRAGVSVPTVWRNFAGRDALLDAVQTESQRRMGAPPWPRDIEEIPSWVPALFSFFEKNLAAVRAARKMAALREIHTRGRAARDRQLRKLVEAATPGMSPAQQAAWTGVFRALLSSQTYLDLMDRFGANRAAAEEVVMQAVAATITALKGQGRGKP